MTSPNQQPAPAETPIKVDLWGPPQGASVNGLPPPPNTHTSQGQPAGDGSGNSNQVASARPGGAHTATPAPRWGLPTAVFGVGVWLSLSVLLSTALLFAAMNSLGLNAEDSLAAPADVIEDEVMRLAGTGKWFLFLQAGSWVGMSIPILWAYFRGGQLGLKFTWSDLWIGAVFAVAAQGCMWLLGWFTHTVGIDMPTNTGMLAAQTGVFLVLSVIGAAVISPFIEELFFRGVFVGAVQRKARKWFGPVVSGILAIVFSSAVFGVFHFTEPTAGGAVLILTTGLLGAGLAVLRVWTGRLGGAIIGHVLFNSFSLAMTLLG